MEQLPGVAAWEQSHLLGVCLHECLVCSFLPPELCAPFSGLSWLVFLAWRNYSREFFRALCNVICPSSCPKEGSYLTLCLVLFLPAVSNIWLCGTPYMWDHVSLAFIGPEFLEYGLSPRPRTKSKCLENL